VEPTLRPVIPVRAVLVAHAAVERKRGTIAPARAYLEIVIAPLLALALLLAAPQPAAKVVTGKNPCGAIGAAGALWVANDGAGTLARIDPKKNRVTRRIKVGRGACELAVGFGAVWVANYRTGSLFRVDLRTYRVRAIRVGDTPFDVVVAAGHVWTTTWRDGKLVEVDPGRSRVVRRIGVGTYPTSMLYRSGVLWVGFGREATDVARVDPASGQVARVAVGVKAPSHFLAAANVIWIVNDGDAIVRLDPANGTVLGTTHAGRTLVQPASAPDGTIWVPDKEIDTIFRIDPATGRVVDAFAGGDGAYNAVRAFGSMWVTSYAGWDVWRFES
jgi:streptogramin lyase